MTRKSTENIKDLKTMSFTNKYYWKGINKSSHQEKITGESSREIIQQLLLIRFMFYFKTQLKL